MFCRDDKYFYLFIIYLFYLGFPQTHREGGEGRHQHGLVQLPRLCREHGSLRRRCHRNHAHVRRGRGQHPLWDRWAFIAFIGLSSSWKVSTMWVILQETWTSTKSWSSWSPGSSEWSRPWRSAWASPPTPWTFPLSPGRWGIWFLSSFCFASDSYPSRSSGTQRVIRWRKSSFSCKGLYIKKKRRKSSACSSV